MLVVALVLFSVTIPAFASQEEMDLVNSLFMNYSPVARPATSTQDPLQLKFGFTISQIIDLVWVNHFLKWDPKKYGGLKMIIVPPESVWKPDIVLYNNVNNDNRRSEIGSESASVHLYHNGTNLWLSPKILKSKCNVDVTYFPFDEQKCTLQFGSWTYDAWKVNLSQEEEYADTKKFTDNSEWALVEVPVEWTMEYFKCCPEPYVYLTYTVVMKRRSLYFVINLILPIMLVAVLSVITFIIPVESGERMSMAIALLLSMFVFMRVVEDIIPETSDVVPMVSYFFTIILIEMTVVVIVNCFIFRAHFPPHSCIPFWLERVLSKYGAPLSKRGQLEIVEDKWAQRQIDSCRCTCIHARMYLAQHKQLATFRANAHPMSGSRFDDLDSCTKLIEHQSETKIGEECSLVNGTHRDINRESGVKAYDMEKSLAMSKTGQDQMLCNINTALNKLTAVEHEKKAAQQWKSVARMLDRFFIWFSGIVVMASIGTLLFHAWPRYTS